MCHCPGFVRFIPPKSIWKKTASFSLLSTLERAQNRDFVHEKHCHLHLVPLSMYIPMTIRRKYCREQFRLSTNKHEPSIEFKFTQRDVTRLTDAS